MTKIAIQVEDVSKLYQLGTIGTGSLKKDLHQWWATSVRKRNDPFSAELSLETNVVNKSHIWALKQVNLDVKQGEVWGIIGGNGSGKSTLLKIISRIVRPTQGVVRGNGRLSSMLEVGTGFHQELSGRENIYLSGYVLGMKRQEIRQRFDEIVEFSGVGPFIDTPVKRYSSGMYVRLAFAVSAHLQSDILIVDEVLAVGDAAFQKKCISKMQDFSHNEGRTILFVSHNMQAVASLCQHALWLQRGKVVAMGPTKSIMNQYINQAQLSQLRQAWNYPHEAPGNDTIRVKSIKLVSQSDEPDAPIDVRTPLAIQFQLWLMQDDLRLLTGIHLFSYSGECILDVMSPFNEYKKGLIEGECIIPGNFLNDGSYYISLIAYSDKWDELYYHQECLTFEVEDHREKNMHFSGKWMGAVRPKLPVRVIQVESNQLLGVTELP